MKQITYKGKPASLILESRHDCKFVCESLDLQTPEGVLMRLKGTFAGPFDDTKNRNGRTYDFTNYYSQVQTLMPKIKAKSLLGELEHCRRRTVKYPNVSHRINEIEWDPTTSTFIGTIDILDTPSGRVAYGIAKAGSPLYISSRAIGVVDPKTGKTTLLKLVTYDLVAESGFANAKMTPVNATAINESVCYVNESEDDDWQDENEQNNQNINPMQNKNTFIAAYLSADASKLGFETIQKVESILDTVGCDYSDTGLGVAYDKLSVEDRQQLHKLLQIDYVTEGDNDGIANRWNGMTEHDREVLLAKVGIEDKDLAKKQFEDLCPEKVQPAISDFFKSNFANESLNLDYLNACWQALDDAAKSEVLEEAKVDAKVAETQNFSDIDEKQQKSIADAMVKLDKAQADMIEIEDAADESVGMPVWQAANENRRKALLKAAGITENIDDIVKTPWLALDNSIRAELNKINVVNEEYSDKLYLNAAKFWNALNKDERAKIIVKVDATIDTTKVFADLHRDKQNALIAYFIETGDVNESKYNTDTWKYNVNVAFDRKSKKIKFYDYEAKKWVDKFGDKVIYNKDINSKYEYLSVDALKELPDYNKETMPADIKRLEALKKRSKDEPHTVALIDTMIKHKAYIDNANESIEAWNSATIDQRLKWLLAKNYVQADAEFNASQDYDALSLETQNFVKEFFSVDESAGSTQFDAFKAWFNANAGKEVTRKQMHEALIDDAERLAKVTKTSSTFDGYITKLQYTGYVKKSSDTSGKITILKKLPDSMTSSQVSAMKYNMDESADFNAGDWWFNAKEAARATAISKAMQTATINVEDAVNATWEMFNDQSKAAIEGAIREAGLVTESEDNDIAKLWSDASQETREAAIKATGLAVEADIKWDELSEEQQATVIRVLAKDEDNVFGKLKNAANSLQKTLDGVDDFDESFEDFVCEAMKYSKKAYNQVIDSMTVEDIVKIKSELNPKWGEWAKKMKDEDKYGNVTMSATHVRTLSDLGDAKAAAEYLEQHFADKLKKAGEQASATQPGKQTKDTVKDGGKYTTMSEYAKYKGKTIALDNAKVPGGWGKVTKVSEDGTMEVQAVNAGNKKVTFDVKDFKELNKKGKQQFKEWQKSQKAGAKDEALDENKRQWALLTIANVDYATLKDIADKFDIEAGSNLATAVIAFTNELNMDEVNEELVDAILKHATVETTDEALSEKEVAEIWDNLDKDQREQAAREGLIDEIDLKHVCANKFANQSKEHQSMIRTGMNIAGFIEECNDKHVNESVASDKLYQSFDNATRILIDRYFTPALIAKVQNLNPQGNSLSDAISDAINTAKANANDTHEKAIESRRSEITKWLAALWQAEQVNESRIKFVPNKSMHIDEADKDDKPTQEDVNDMVDGLVDANIIKQQQKDELLDALADADGMDKLNNKAELAEKIAEVANDLGFDVDVDDCMSMVNESAEDGVRNALLKDRGFDDFTFKTVNRDGETYSVVVTKDDNQLVGIEVAGDMTENAQSTLASMLRTYLAQVNTDEALIEIRRAIKQINLDESRIEKLYTDKGLKVVDESLIDVHKSEPIWKSKMPQAYRLIFESLTDDQRDLVATQASVRTFVNEADVAAFFRSRNWNAIRNYQAQDRSTWVNESKVVDEGLNEHGLTAEQQALVDAIKG